MQSINKIYIRLGFKFVKDAYHIFLNISEEKAIERIKKSNRENESFETINKRNESFKNQFYNTYGVDYTAINNYDLCVNVEEFKSAEDVVEYITECLKISTQRHSNNL